MGCCNGNEFEAAVRKQTFLYINTLSVTSAQKDQLKVMIEDDLRKKVAAFDSYHYVTKDEDVDKVVKEYRDLIQKTLNMPAQPLVKNQIESQPQDPQNPNNNLAN